VQAWPREKSAGSYLKNNEMKNSMAQVVEPTKHKAPSSKPCICQKKNSYFYLHFSDDQ
jgi:hypothetical protein